MSSLAGLFMPGQHRLDWGFGNPNKTAALIAMLMITVWALVFIRRVGFWVALVLFFGLAVCLIRTASRGGLVSLVCGLVPLLMVAPRPWKLRHIGAVIFGVIALAVFAGMTGSATRYVRDVREDRSILSRGIVYRQVPRMMFDAPGGWGLGNAAQAYMQWYQPIDDLDSYKNLLNSHFTWMVEFNWLLRFAYIFAWISVFLFCWPFNRNRWFAVPLGIWITFAVAASFSAVAESIFLWILPGAALVIVILGRVFQRNWPAYFQWSIPAMTAVVLTGGLFSCGWLNSTTEAIAGSGSKVQVGNGQPVIWVVSPEPKIIGDHYGHAIREANITIGVARSLENVPKASAKVLVIMGNVPSQLPSRPFERLVIFNPSGVPDARLDELRSVSVVWGQFRHLDIRSEWERWVQAHPQFQFIEAKGCSEYIPNWLQQVEKSGGA